MSIWIYADFMEESELKQIYGHNIKRLREERKMTQDRTFRKNRLE